MNKLELFKAVYAQSYEAKNGKTNISLIVNGTIEVSENNEAGFLYHAGAILNMAEICNCNTSIICRDKKPIIIIY